MGPLAARVLVCAVLLVTMACSSSSGALRASGAIGDRATSARVDSELARRYLATPAGDARIDALRAKYDAMELNRATLRALSMETSPDFATIYFARRILADRANRDLQARVEAETAALRLARSGADGGQDARNKGRSRPPRDLLVLLVPGYLYKTDSSTGADLQREMDTLKTGGFAVERVATLDDGTVEENSHLVANRLRQARSDGRRVILVSGSKGGPETAHALGVVLSPGETDHVVAWVSAAGLMRGTPVADDMAEGPKGWTVRALMWARQLDPEGLRSITTTQSTSRLAQAQIPGHIFILQYIAVPLSGQVTDDARGRYEFLRSYGPNDGVSLLADELIGGATVLEVGVDHYFRQDDQALRTLAVARVLTLDREPAPAAAASSVSSVSSSTASTASPAPDSAQTAP